MRRIYYIITILAALLFSCAPGPLQNLRQAEYAYQQGDIQQFDRIVEVLLSNKEASREAALILGRIGDKRATPYLVDVINSEGLAAKEAVIAIGMLQDTRAVTDLIQIIKLNKPEAPEAVKALGQLKDRRALPILIKAVEEDMPYSLLAIEALGEIGDRQAVEPLLKKLKQPPIGVPENIQFRILRQDEEKQHLLTFEMPVNLPPKIEILDRIMKPEGRVIFHYQLKDTEYDSLDILAEFSIDDGGNWYPASTEGKLRSLVENEYRGSVLWRTDLDIDLNNLRLYPDVGLLFKLIPIDKHPNPRHGVPSVWTFNVDTTTIDIQDIIEEESDDVLFRINYSNPARAAIDSFAYHFTTDRGENWFPASVRLGRAAEVTMQDILYVIWSSDIDLPNLDMDEVQFRVSENIHNTYGRYDITLPFHVDNNTVPKVEFLNFNEDKDGMFYIGYQITDIENDIIALVVQYSEDQGRAWRQATVSGDLSNIIPDQYMGEIKWFADFDITDFRNKPVRLRIRPFDRDPGEFIDSRDFFLKNAESTKLTRGLNSGLVELSHTVAKDDTSSLIAQYSFNRGKTWQDASLTDVSEQILPDKKNVTVNWDVNRDISSFLKQIEAIGKSLDKIQDPSIVPDLLHLTREKNSPYRERRQQAVEASRLLNQKPQWVIQGLINTLIHPDRDTQAEALAILKTVDTPEVRTAIADYEYYWSQQPRDELEERALAIELVEQQYQEELRKPRITTQDELINSMIRWWGLTPSKAESFIKDLDVLKVQTKLKEEFEAGRIPESEYLDKLEKLLTESRRLRVDLGKEEISETEYLENLQKLFLEILKR